MRTLLIGMTAAATTAVAQTPPRPDPADAKQGAITAPSHESALRDYRPYADPQVGRWRQINDEVGRLNGHSGHVPRKPDDRPAPAAPVHGSHK